MKNKLVYLFFAVTALLCCFTVCAFAGFDLSEDEILELEPVENLEECYASGDVDGNGAIKADDARTILRVSVNLENIDTSSFMKADVDGDGKITAKDARTALRYAVGLDKLPQHDVEEIVIIPATCETEGLTVKICKTCLKIYAKITVPAKEDGHVTTGRWVTVKAPNCSEEGLGQLKCVFCSAVVKEEVLPKLKTHSGDWLYPDGKSCTDVHIRKRSCSICGIEETEEINPRGGCQYKWIIIKDKTCTENGYRIEKCDYCGKERDLNNADNIVKATGHLYERELLIKEATCTEPGIIADQCVNCQETINTRELVPTGHNFDNIHYKVTKEPTCSQEGSADVFCIECSTSATLTLPKKEHTLTEEWTVTKEPTCTEAGEKTGVCKYCEEVTEEIAPTGHTVTKWENTKPATCAEAGLRTGYCEACGESTVTEEIAPLPHTFDKRYIYVASGVACKGVWEGYYKCTVCGAHSATFENDQKECSSSYYKNTAVVTEATCTTKKTVVDICDYCKENIKGTERVSGTALGHSYSNDWNVLVAATCTENGKAEVKCVRCDATTVKVIEKLGHTPGEWNTVTAPTCTEDGSAKAKCIRCDVEATKTLEKLGHKLGEKEVFVAPTCTEDGTGGKSCVRCDYKETEILEKLGHELGEWTETKAPTCTEDGALTAKCTRCDLTETKIVEKLGHEPGEWIETKAPTCTEDGILTSKCSRCDDFDTKTVAKLGHELGEWTETKAPSCSEEGELTAECSRCGGTETKPVEKLPHTPGEWVVISEATCLTGEISAKICTVCNETVETKTGATAAHTEKKAVIAGSEYTDESGNLCIRYNVICSVCQSVITENLSAEKVVVEGNGITVTFADGCSTSAGGEVTFTINSDSSHFVMITYGNEGATEILTENGGSYSFTIPEDLTDSETVTIIIL